MNSISFVGLPVSLSPLVVRLLVFPQSSPSSFHVYGWRLVFLHASSLPDLLPPPLPLTLAGAFSLALGLLPLPAVYSSLGYLLLRSWCRFSLSPGLVTPWGVLLFLLGYLGASLPGISMLSLQFCFLPGFPVLLVHGFHLPLRVALGFFPSSLTGCDLRFPCCNSFSSCLLLGILGVWLPCLLSLPFQCYPLLTVFGSWSACLVLRLFVSFLDLPSSLLLPFVASFPSFGALLTQSNLRFTTRRGLPLGRVCFWFTSWRAPFTGLACLAFFSLFSVILLLLRSLHRWSVRVPFLLGLLSFRVHSPPYT